MIDEIIKAGIFTKEWKVGRLVLIRKPDKNKELLNSYRPIYVLDSLGKFVEHIVAATVRKDLESKAKLSD